MKVELVLTAALFAIPISASSTETSARQNETAAVRR